MNQRIERSAKERNSIGSYADRAHRYIAYICHKNNPHQSKFIAVPDGTLRFRKIDWVTQAGYVYGDETLSINPAIKLIENGSKLPERYKRAQLKALIRIGLLYGATYGNIRGVNTIQDINGYIHETKNNRWRKKKPNFIVLYKSLKDSLEQNGKLPPSQDLEKLCEEHLLERNMGDPTRKFRVESRKRAMDDEMRQEIWSAEKEDR
ncbi:MAG TPA: hypothetical protein VJK07_00535 [Candidatus Nanoarchaeia archaeon]|nr:hypothetical protein [Candidatus Nanoarchaeia archaeon]